MVKFITKSVCMALIAMLCVSTLSAQTERSAPKGMQPSIQAADVSLNSFSAFASVRGSDSETIATTGSGPTWKGTVANPLAQQIGNAGAVQCLDYIEGVYYGVRWSGGNQFGTVDPTTGAFTIIKSAFHVQGTDGASICYNPVDGKTYVFPWTGDAPEATRYGTVDLATGDFTTIATFPEDISYTYYTAIDADGTCYAVRHGSTDFGTVNLATGTFTPTATLNTGDIQYIQDISFDRETGELYWIAQTTSGNYYYKIDKATGTVTNLGANTQNPQGFAIKTWFGSGGDDCPVVTNVTAVQFKGTQAKISWTAPSVTEDLTGYKIYDGTTEIGSVAVGVTTFVTGNLTSGEHTFAVEAIYDNDCTPKKATATLTIKTCGNAIENVDVQYDADCKATVTWDAVAKGAKILTLQPTEPVYEETPVTVINNSYVASGQKKPVSLDNDGGSRDGWIKWCGANAGDGIGATSSPTTYSPGARFLPADLAAASIQTGDELSKVSIYIYSGASVCTFTLNIYQGGTSPTNPGSLMYTQPLTLIDGDNEIVLTTPLEIDASQELWITYQIVQSSSSNPAGMDGGPRIIDKGDIFNDGGSWNSFYAITGGQFNLNWNIEGYVEAGGTPQAPKYNVYMGDELVAEGIEATTYTHNVAVEQGEDVEWCVTQVCSGGGESEAGCKTVKCGEAPPPPCNPVTALTVTIPGEGEGDCAATLNWTAPADMTDVTYNVYKDGTLLGNVAVTEYEDTDIEENTEYTWTVKTASADCEGGESTGVDVKGTCTRVGINELTNSVSIYPNPAASTVTIDAKDFAKVEIYNTVGQLIETRTINIVDVSAYNTGIYFFKVYDLYNNSVTKRVMVAK